MTWFWNLGLGSFKVIEHGVVQQTMYDFLLVRHCNYSAILYHLRVIKPPLATARAGSCNGPVHLFVYLSVCLSRKYKNAIFSKTKNRKSYVEFSKNPLLDPKNPRCHLENRHYVIFFCRGWSDLDKISQTGAEWHVDCGDMAEIETKGGRLAEFNGMSS